ncbi:hypothetical protein TRICHSKD4_2421 [Roseibium sp. TrichSKD4]|uniref:gene transfer agent family protein n=1 Tax=Roseibium sp. TrichSKD4 TaxID=744980 RepID=UPI0001E56B8E|nr:gene transfer agent family protein [Roseibium sp. TrichSKD4]EFO32619.1 hypothetical protein TRICHSKD4_2421 [Roseibium sp. TrichSKD4]
MSRDGSLQLKWADGEYSFRLGWGEIEQLQETMDCGPQVMLSRLLDGSWRIGDIAHVIRLGLMGGGMPASEAASKVDYYVKQRPIAENVTHAVAILQVALFGVPDEEVGGDTPGNLDAPSA